MYIHSPELHRQVVAGLDMILFSTIEMGDVQAPTGFQDDIVKVYPHSKMGHIDKFSPPKHRDKFNDLTATSWGCWFKKMVHDPEIALLERDEHIF